MKILIANCVRGIREAGAAAVVFQHAAELRKYGHQVDTWFLEDILNPARWPARLELLEFSVRLDRRIRRDPSRYDVVNLHAPSGCVYGTRKSNPTSGLPPYVFTMHGCEQRYTVVMRQEHKKHRAAHFALKNRLWHRLYHQTMYDFAISKADGGAVVNREGWLFSELHYQRPSGCIWYIPNGIGEEFFHSRTFSDAPASRLLFVGTWLDRKGIYYLVDALSLLAPQIPQLHLTIAGCSVPETVVKSDFPAELHSRLTIIPFVARDAMPELYARNDIFIFPSLMEGMPLTLLEAMAAAMPVVTTNTCGMADVVEDGFNGLLVPPADAPAIEQAVLQLAAPQLRQQLGEAAQHSMRRYTWERSARLLESLFRRVIAGKSQTSA